MQGKIKTLTAGGKMKHHDTMQIELDHISEEVTRHGKRVIYARYKGRRKRLLHPPSSPEFIEEYRIALRVLGAIPSESTSENHKKTTGKHQTFAPRTFGWLILRYFNESPDFKVMKKTGQIRRRRILESVALNHGHKSMIIPTDRIYAGLSARAEKPGAANEWLKSLKALYTWAKKIRLIDNSPAAGVSKIKITTDGFHTWSIEEMRSYILKHPKGTMAYLVFMVLLYTGLRRSDAIKIGRQHIKSGKIYFKTSKTGADLSLHLPWPLEDAIAAMPQSGQLTLMLNHYDKPFASGAAFGNWFKDRCTEAGIAHCTAHGLRKAGAKISAENGASEVEHNAMYCWSNNKQSGVYTRQAQSLLLATSGFAKITLELVREGLLTEQNALKIVAP